MTLDRPISQLHHALQSGELSPLDIAQHTVTQVEKLESQVKAWEAFDPERLLNEAKTVDVSQHLSRPLRPLEAIPVGVKDNMNTEDFPTQMGSRLWKGFTPGNDARVVFHAKRQGGLIAGKTVTAEFAVHALDKTLNPHHADYNPGTSSSGSAASVATNMVQVALGSQTAGSIVRPASYCGVYGVKPSFGLIPRTGVLKTTDTLDTIGFFVRHFEDYVPVLDTLRVEGPNYPVSYAALRQFGLNLPKKEWKVALIKPNSCWEHACDEAKAALDEWAKKLDGLDGVSVDSVSLPDMLDDAHRIHATIYNKTLSYYFQGEYENKEDVSPIMSTLIEAGQDITPQQYIDATRQQEQCITEITEWFKSYDVVITLSTAGSAPLRDAPEPPDSALIWTLLHLPTISAPAFTAGNGMPFGLQLVGPKYSDYQLGQFVERCIEAELLPKKNAPEPAVLSQLLSAAVGV